MAWSRSFPLQQRKPQASRAAIKTLLWTRVAPPRSCSLAELLPPCSSTCKTLPHMLCDLRASSQHSEIMFTKHCCDHVHFIPALRFVLHLFSSGEHSSTFEYSRSVRTIDDTTMLNNKHRYYGACNSVSEPTITFLSTSFSHQFFSSQQQHAHICQLFKIKTDYSAREDSNSSTSYVFHEYPTGTNTEAEKHYNVKIIRIL